MDKSIRAQELFDRYLQAADDRQLGSDVGQTPEDVIRENPDCEQELRALFKREEEMCIALAEYFEQLDSGNPRDPEILFRTYPEIADELRAYFEASESIGELTDEASAEESKIWQATRIEPSTGDAKEQP